MSLQPVVYSAFSPSTLTSPRSPLTSPRNTLTTGVHTANPRLSLSAINYSPDEYMIPSGANLPLSQRPTAVLTTGVTSERRLLGVPGPVEYPVPSDAELQELNRGLARKAPARQVPPPRLQRDITTNNGNAEKVLNCDCGPVEDSMGFGIFQLIKTKYEKDNVFHRALLKIRALETTGSITMAGVSKLHNVVDMYSLMNTKFVNDVVNKRQYIQKAGSGGKPIIIKTPKEWGEAIIEYINLLNNFDAVLQSTIQEEMNSKTLKRECAALPLDQCSKPCAKLGIIKKTCGHK